MDRTPGAKRLDARVLLVEDSVSDVSLIQAYFAETGCCLEVAGDGESGFRRLREGAYNLVLIPGPGGYEVMRGIREWERTNRRTRTPIVAVAAQTLEEDVDLAIKAGADALLTKPLRRDSLLDAIELYQRQDDASDVRVDVPVFIQQLAPEFLRRQRSGLLAVRSAFRAGEFEPIRSFAHNMKGCGKSFGFPRLTDLGRDLERDAKERDAESVRLRIQDIRDYLTEVDIA